MPRFSQRSKDQLATCHPDLQLLLEEAIKHTDFTVICGHRNEEDQERAYQQGRSKLRFPMSRHNKSPSRAVDVAPYPIDWSDIDRFVFLATHILAVASRLGIRVKWGGHWIRFRDYPHYELIL